MTAAITRRTCKLEDCGQPHNAKGYCGAHYRNWKRSGDPLGRWSRKIPAQRLASLRALVGLDPDGPTAEQLERWELQEGAS
jgi:hypothetical protein